MARGCRLAVLAAGILALPTCLASVFDARDFGAVGDGTTLNTAALARALAEAASAPVAASGVNVVRLSGGRFLSGQVVLPSSVYLEIAPDAVLLGSTNVSDYPRAEDRWALVFAEGATNIGIVGGGAVDGQQPLWIGGWDEVQNRFTPAVWLPGECQGECRPRNVRFRNCKDILLEDVLIANSPDWTIHFEASENILVRRVRQYGDYRWPNNDGIDVDSSRNVTIVDTSINTGDDGLCIKSTSGLGPVLDVVVRNTTIRSRSAAIKFGSNTDENCMNLLFENITIYDSNRGIGLQQRSQGNISGVTFRDMNVETRYSPATWWGSAEPIYISSMPRAAGGAVGVISNITFERITARSENSAFLSGRAPGMTLRGIVLRDVSILIDKWSNYSTPAHSYIPTTAVTPELVTPPNMAVDGVYVEAAAGVVLSNVSVTFAAKAQPFWSRTCFNFSLAGHSVTQTGCTCSGRTGADSEEERTSSGLLFA